MAEQMSEEQILSAFERGPGANSEADVSQQQAQQPVEAAQNAQVEGEDAPSGETESQPAAADQEQDQTQAIEIDPDEPLFEQEITDNGKKEVKKLSLKELQRGYIAQAETTRRFQEAAKLRAEAESVARQAQQQASTEYVKSLEQLQALVVASAAPELQNVDWNKLANEDAFEYIRLSNRAKQINDTLQKIKAEKDSIESKQKEEKQKLRSEKIAKAESFLKENIADYSDETAKRLIKAATDVGFTQEDLSDGDHRLFMLAHKAALYDDLNNKQATEKQIAAKKVAIVSKTLKPGTTTAKSNPLDEARKQLRKTGKAEAALPIFEAMIR